MRLVLSTARASVVLAAVLLTIGCASGGGRMAPVSSPPPLPPAASEAAAPLEGEWRLTAFQLADGSTRKVSGFLRFDRFSNLTLHAELAPDDPAARPPRTVVADFTARAVPDNGQFDFVGLAMGVGPERLTVDAVSMAEWRHYELAGSVLRVSVRDRSGRQAATLVFER